MWQEEHSRSEDKNYCRTLIFTKPEFTITKKRAEDLQQVGQIAKNKHTDPGCRWLDT